MTDRPIYEIIQPPENAMKSYSIEVQASWLDYNGHMTEFRFVELFCEGEERFLQAIGFDTDYREKGYTFFSARAFVHYLRECKFLDELAIYTSVVESNARQFKLLQYLTRPKDNTTVAIAEQVMVHVDTRSRRPCDLLPELKQGLQIVSNKHAMLLKPDNTRHHISPHDLVALTTLP